MSAASVTLDTEAQLANYKNAHLEPILLTATVMKPVATALVEAFAIFLRVRVRASLASLELAVNYKPLCFNLVERRM